MANEQRLINANTLPVTTLTDGEYWTKDVVYKRDIDEAPTVDAVEVVHAEWIPCDHSNEIYICSNCRFQKNAHDRLLAFCPNCGAKMDGDI